MALTIYDMMSDQDIDECIRQIDDEINQIDENLQQMESMLMSNEEYEEDECKEDDYYEPDYVDRIISKEQLDLIDIIIVSRYREEVEVNELIDISLFGVPNESKIIKELIKFSIMYIKRTYHNSTEYALLNLVVNTIDEFCCSVNTFLYNILEHINLEKENSRLYDYISHDDYIKDIVAIKQYINNELDNAAELDVCQLLKDRVSHEEIKYLILRKNLAQFTKDKRMPYSIEERRKAKSEKYKEFLLSNRPHEIVNKLDKYVYGQHEAKKSLALSLYQYIKGCAYGDESKNPVVMVCGPVGNGKTELIRSIKRILKDTMAVNLIDAGNFSPNGYKGTNICEALYPLWCNGELKHSILVIDEIDKIISPEYSSEGGNSNIDIQNDCLKLFENDRLCHGDKVMETDCMIILVGSFEWLKRNNPGYDIGFNSQKKINTCSFDELLIKNGMTREFRRRIDKIISIDELKEEDYENLFKENLSTGIYSECRALSDLDNIELTYDKDIIALLGSYGYEKHMGVSGINALFRNAYEEQLYEALSTGSKHINITRENIQETIDKENVFFR